MQKIYLVIKYRFCAFSRAFGLFGVFCALFSFVFSVLLQCLNIAIPMGCQKAKMLIKG